MDKTPKLEITQERGRLSHSTYFVLTAKFGEEMVSLRLSDNDYSRMFGGGDAYNALAAQKWFESLGCIIDIERNKTSKGIKMNITVAKRDFYRGDFEIAVNGVTPAMIDEGLQSGKYEMGKGSSYGYMDTACVIVRKCVAPNESNPDDKSLSESFELIASCDELYPLPVETEYEFEDYEA